MLPQTHLRPSVGLDLIYYFSLCPLPKLLFHGLQKLHDRMSAVCVDAHLLETGNYSIQLG